MPITHLTRLCLVLATLALSACGGIFEDRHNPENWPKPNEEDLTKLGMRLQFVLDSQDPEAFLALFNDDYFSHELAKENSALYKVEGTDSEIKALVRDDFDEFFEADSTQEFAHLKSFYRGNQAFMLFHSFSSSDLHFYEFALTNYKGQLKVGDVYVYSQGETWAEEIRDYTLTSLKGNEAEIDAAMASYLNVMERAYGDEYVDISFLDSVYQELPQKLQKLKFVMEMQYLALYMNGDKNLNLFTERMLATAPQDKRYNAYYNFFGAYYYNDCEVMSGSALPAMQALVGQDSALLFYANSVCDSTSDDYITYQLLQALKASTKD